MIAITFVGLISHLVLDFLTTRGVPLFYPWNNVRYSAEIFFQTEMIIMIASLVVLAELFREKRSKDRSPTRSKRNLLVIFLAFFILVGAIRIEGKETTQSFFSNENAKVYPDSGLFQWAVLEDDLDRFHVYEFNSLLGETEHSSTFFRIFIPSEVEGSRKAIEAAEKLSQVRLFRWRAYAVAINVSFQDGSWYLEYYDPIVKTEMMNTWPILQMAMKSYGSLRVKVDGEKADGDLNKRNFARKFNPMSLAEGIVTHTCHISRGRLVSLWAPPSVVKKVSSIPNTPLSG